MTAPLDSPGSAAPDSRDADETSDVFVLPGLGLLGEEVQRHDGAHAVAHQQHWSVPVLNTPSSQPRQQSDRDLKIVPRVKEPHKRTG